MSNHGIDTNWSHLEGGELLAHIAGHEDGLAFEADTATCAAFLLDTMYTRLNGHSRKVEFKISTLGENGVRVVVVASSPNQSDSA